MERVRHQLACANCMLANANLPVNKDYHFFCKISPIDHADYKFYQSFMNFSHIITYYLDIENIFNISYIFIY